MGSGFSKSTNNSFKNTLFEGLGASELDYFEKPETFYEAFSPSILFELGELDIATPVTGKYYIFIYFNSIGVHFNFALGRRKLFKYTEIFLLPIQIIKIC